MQSPRANCTKCEREFVQKQPNWKKCYSCNFKRPYSPRPKSTDCFRPKSTDWPKIIELEPTKDATFEKPNKTSETRSKSILSTFSLEPNTSLPPGTQTFTSTESNCSIEEYFDFFILPKENNQQIIDWPLVEFQVLETNNNCQRSKSLQLIKSSAPIKSLSSKLVRFHYDYRAYGHFNCVNCGSKWQSAHAFLTKGQQCRVCGLETIASKRFGRYISAQSLDQSLDDELNCTEIDCKNNKSVENFTAPVTMVSRFIEEINIAHGTTSPTPSVTELAPSPTPCFFSPAKSDDSYVKRQKRRSRRNRRKTKKIEFSGVGVSKSKYLGKKSEFDDVSKLEFEILPEILPKIMQDTQNNSAENEKNSKVKLERKKSVACRIEELEKMLESTENIISTVQEAAEEADVQEPLILLDQFKLIRDVLTSNESAIVVDCNSCESLTEFYEESKKSTSRGIVPENLESTSLFAISVPQSIEMLASEMIPSETFQLEVVSDLDSKCHTPFPDPEIEIISENEVVCETKKVETVEKYVHGLNPSGDNSNLEPEIRVQNSKSKMSESKSSESKYTNQVTESEKSAQEIESDLFSVCSRDENSIVLAVNDVKIVKKSTDQVYKVNKKPTKGDETCCKTCSIQ